MPRTIYSKPSVYYFMYEAKKAQRVPFSKSNNSWDGSRPDYACQTGRQVVTLDSKCTILSASAMARTNREHSPPVLCC